MKKNRMKMNTRSKATTLVITLSFGGESNKENEIEATQEAQDSGYIYK